MSGVPPCGAAPCGAVSPYSKRRAITRRLAPFQRAVIRARSRRFRCARSTGSSITAALKRAAANPRRTEVERPLERSGFSTKLTRSRRKSTRARVDLGGITTITLDAASGIKIRTVFRSKLVPRICAKGFGDPRRVESPAASTTIWSLGRVLEFIAMMVL
jgi:hypothetical protein